MLLQLMDKISQSLRTQKGSEVFERKLVTGKKQEIEPSYFISNIN